MPFIDFGALKQRVSIDQAAQMLGLTLQQSGNQLRCACPFCKQGGDRAIVLTPSKGLFYCFPSKIGGDCIRLVAHVLDVSQQDAALFLANQIGDEDCTSPPLGDSTVSKPHATAPQKQEGRTEKSQPAPTSFDPEEYASKLQYTDDVAKLGISEPDAKRLRIGYAAKGFHKDRVVFPIRNEDGSIAGFVGARGADIKLPTRWLQPKVVQLKRA